MPYQTIKYFIISVQTGQTVTPQEEEEEEHEEDYFEEVGSQDNQGEEIETITGPPKGRATVTATGGGADEEFPTISYVPRSTKQPLVKEAKKGKEKFSPVTGAT